MEKTDQEDEPQEIFQECNNTDTILKEECKESFGDLNLPQQKEELVHFANYKQNNSNNNHHVVPIGVIIVFITIYLGMTSVQKCLVSCVENNQINEQVQQQHKEDILNYLQKSENLENSQILERLLEYKDICKDLEVFTKDIEPKSEDNEEDEEEDNTGEILKGIEVSAASGEEEGEEGSSIELVESSSSGASGNGDCAKASRTKHKKSKYSIKTTNSKNGFNKYNKSTKAKSQKNQKKELNISKKNSTAEPIIYLFALVFIYLLLKAASDINQHYKSQNKNDKRLRRCSLQSYAQTHRPDRRASKGISAKSLPKFTTELALKQKQQLQQQQRLKTLSRSSSQDQQNYPYSQHHQPQQHLMDSSPPKTEQQQHVITTTGSSSRTNVSYSSNWQLLRQHTTTQSLDNSDILNFAQTPSSSMMARRCSVPAALSYQRQKISTVSPLSIVNDHVNVNVSLSRRTSITSPIPLAMDPNDSLGTETKRRVRMINRH
ncbi:uncharacterized protein LOC135959981 [Calliphora vicina]|uniref:uncharacterized protein LOC135959981 n=1 Tax=Calliphora vicina TaxID=7373 RepID=UPI00325A585C